MAVLALIWLLAVCLFPLVCGVVFLCRRSTQRYAFFMGCACFLVFQLLTRLPLLSLLNSSTSVLLFQSTQPVAYVGLLSLSAGLFEECGRYCTMRFLGKGKIKGRAAAFGLGHGGTEALSLVALPLLLSLPSAALSADAGQIALSGLERLSALLLHVGLSVLVCRIVSQNRPWRLCLPIMIHTLFNFSGSMLLLAGISLAVTELILFLIAVGVAAYSICLEKQDRRNFNEKML